MDIEKKTIAAEAGQSFVVSLESMPGSTGFSWALSRLETGLLLTGEDTQQHMSGGCGHVVQAFSFIAVKAGEFHLGFQLVRLDGDERSPRPRAARSTTSSRCRLRRPGTS